MDTKNVFSKENIILYVVMIIQIYALTFLGSIAMELYQAIALFGTGEEFKAIYAECIDVQRVNLSSKANSAKVYNNTYEYEVEGEVYSVTFEGEDDRGKDCTLYYKQSRPVICSRYHSISDIMVKQSGKLVLALVLQMCIIVYFYLRRKNRG